MEKIIDYLKNEYNKLDPEDRNLLDFSVFDLSDSLMGAAGRSRDTAAGLGKIDAAAGSMQQTLNDTLAETMELIDRSKTEKSSRLRSSGSSLLYSFFR